MTDQAQPKNDPDTPVPHPNWVHDISGYFTAKDIAEMRERGLDLADYDDVRTHSVKIFQVVESGFMPMVDPEDPDDGPRRWSANRVANFDTWRRHGHPYDGDGDVVEHVVEYMDVGAPRLRKEVRQLDEEEVAALTRAWEGILALPIDNPHSFFAHASLHYYPTPAWCHHHITTFYPWHRAQLRALEDSLRTIKGCGDVTLPYWDFEDLTEPPELLYAEPFYGYELPIDIIDEPEGGWTYDPDDPDDLRNPERYYRAGYIFGRKAWEAEGDTGDDWRQWGVKRIFEDLRANLEAGMGESTWEGFNGFLESGFNGTIAAHDDGHRALSGAFGTTSYDPMFWLFHCNWDRLWWKWQKHHRATTVETLIARMDGEDGEYGVDAAKYFTDPHYGILEPYQDTPVPDAGRTVDSIADVGVGYSVPNRCVPTPVRGRGVGSQKVGAASVELDAERVSVRVKGVDRIAIPGSFDLILRADAEVIGRRGFAQPDKPEGCPNCVQNRRVTFDFVVPLDAVRAKALTVEARMWEGERPAADLSPAAIGDPTIQARLLIR